MITRRSMFSRIAAALSVLPFLPRKSSAYTDKRYWDPKFSDEELLEMAQRVHEQMGPRPFAVRLKHNQTTDTYDIFTPDEPHKLLASGIARPASDCPMHPAHFGMVIQNGDTYRLIYCDEHSVMVTCCP